MLVVLHLMFVNHVNIVHNVGTPLCVPRVVKINQFTHFNGAPVAVMMEIVEMRMTTNITRIMSVGIVMIAQIVNHVKHMISTAHVVLA